MFKVGLAALSLFNLAARPCVAADTTPDPRLTPGSARTTDPIDACAHTKASRHRMTRARSDEVMRRYGLPPGPHPDYELDHLIPICLGGADDASNLWPQPRRGLEAIWNAERKDRLEAKMCRMVCSGQIALPEAQLVFTGDWVAAYRVYFEGAPPP